MVRKGARSDGSAVDLLAAQGRPPRPAYSAPRDPASAAVAAREQEIARLQREVQRRMREAMPEVAATQVAGQK